MLSCIGMRSASAKQPAPSDRASRIPFLAGGDISLLSKEEQLGQVYKDNGNPMDFLTICKQRGWNCMRLRLWVKPTGQGVFVNDLPYTEALGRRIKRAGFYLLLDLHYSDTWADPGKQFKPAAWENFSFDQLTKHVHDYTQTVIASMREAGAMPDIVQIGNEITGGMLWPDGKDWGPGHDFKNLAALLKAGIAGVKDGSGNQPPPLIMIHIDRGGDWDGTKWFFDNIEAEGVPFDLIGESFYPFFQGKLSQLKDVLDNAARRYHKPIVVVETGYPFKTAGRAFRGPNSAVFAFAATPEGQSDFLTALAQTVRETPDRLGRGVIYWEPEWLPIKGLGQAWNTTALFDDNGNALPGLSALGRAASAKP